MTKPGSGSGSGNIYDKLNVAANANPEKKEGIYDRLSRSAPPVPEKSAAVKQMQGELTKKDEPIYVAPQQGVVSQQPLYSQLDTGIGNEYEDLSTHPARQKDNTYVTMKSPEEHIYEEIDDKLVGKKQNLYEEIKPGYGTVKKYSIYEKMDPVAGGKGDGDKEDIQEFDKEPIYIKKSANPSRQPIYAMPEALRGEQASNISLEKKASQKVSSGKAQEAIYSVPDKSAKLGAGSGGADIPPAIDRATKPPKVNRSTKPKENAQDQNSWVNLAQKPPVSDGRSGGRG